MPTTPHIVNGTVNFSGTSQAVASATVSLVHTNGTLSTTTNASGQYILNLSGLSSWISGDSITVTASIGNRSKATTTTVTGGGTVINFVLDITTYPNYNFQTEEAVAFNALDLMDVDKIFTYSNNRITKEVANYGKITITKYFKYDSTGRVINENRVIE